MTGISAPPRAAILIESMRDIGYTLETALADVVDNSISAGAKRISIGVNTTTPPLNLGIADDGRGMTKEELVQAMRLGSRHPKETRAKTDLGRFGLGLKTASFSQCRKLTVVSRHLGETHALAWDLDEIEKSDSWTLQEVNDHAKIPFIKLLGENGVLVVWEKLDRAVENESTTTGRQEFIHRISEAGEHLELVFHRFLEPEAREGKVKIFINNTELVAFDPFHAKHSATMKSPPETITLSGFDVTVTAYTLPHHNNVSREEWDKYAGKAGYLRNQGFYLYRARRLIVHGTWFGLARQTEITRLARVRIDMPNGLDASWQVDVKKASARPPIQVRERLKTLIAGLGAPARRVYERRGARLHGNAIALWQRLQVDGQIRYALNRGSPPIEQFKKTLGEEQQRTFERLLTAMSAGLPMEALWADWA
jgi:hypothetical protein